MRSTIKAYILKLILIKEFLFVLFNKHLIFRALHLIFSEFQQYFEIHRFMLNHFHSIPFLSKYHCLHVFKLSVLFK